MPQMNISIPEGLKGWIDIRLADGRYSSTSDYVRDLVRRDQESAGDETAWLQAEIDKGLASPTLDRDAFQVIDDIIAAGRAKQDAA
jgi:antitoxin ParD1/3/4